MAENPRLLAALAYAARGWRVLVLWWPTPDGCACSTPGCQNVGKHPLSEVCPKGVHSATVDADLIRSWFERFPDANLGIAGGVDSGLWMLDVDPRHGGHLTLEALEQRYGKLPTSLRARTGSGGWHIFFRHPGDGRLSNSAGRLGKGLDVRADGGYVVAAPSPHASGRDYTWEDEETSVLELAPAWLLELIGERYPDDVDSGTDADAVSLPDAEGEIIARLKLQRAVKRIREGLSRHQTATWLFKQLHDNRVSRPVAADLMDTLLTVCNEVGDHPVKRVELSKILTWAYKTRQRGADPTQPLASIAAIHDDIARHKAIRDAAAAQAVPARIIAQEVQRLRVAAAAPSPDDWRARLIYKQTQAGAVLESCLHNAGVILTHHEAWRGHVRWDSFAGRAVANGVPLDAVSHDTPWSDLHTAQATAWLQRETHVMLSADVVATAVSMAAHASEYHPVQDYLAGLVWDGVERLDFWLEDLCGVERTTYSSAVGRRWLISAVARMLQPGCKADSVLILEGAQGAMKSTTLEALFAPWFTDDLDLLGSKDSALQIRGVWCVELAELDSMHRSEVSRVKAFLARRTDRYRPPYGREVVEQPRTVVFSGSTNKDTYLSDDTGGRRFWGVRCGTLDPAATAARRDQLWAEAVTRYRAGEPWWLDQAPLVTAAQMEQEHRYQADSWEDSIASALETWNPMLEVTTESVLSALKLEIGRHDRASQIRAGSCLHRLGYVKRRRTNGERGYFYVRSAR